jgi:hypothetical protein
MKYIRRSPWLISQSGNDVGITKIGQGFFHQRAQPGSPGYEQEQLDAGAGQSEQFPWVSRGAGIALTPGTPTSQPIVIADNYRNLLIIQNNSTATAAGDVAPNLYINVDGPVNVAAGAFALLFPPGFGIFMDERILSNALYVAFAGAVNTGNSVVTAGVLTYGRTPNSPPLTPLQMLKLGG